ncbi:hypothetical protein ACWGBH_08590 [Streptomyces massasporeus]
MPPKVKSVDQRVEMFLEGNPDDDLVQTYLTELRSLESDTDRSMRRAVAGIALLVTAFILLSQNRISDVSVPFFKLGSTDFVACWLPPIIAYQFLQILLLLQDFVYASAVHDAIIAKKCPAMYEQDLALLLGPPSNSWLQARKIYRLYASPGKRATFLVYVVGLGVLLPVFLMHVISGYLIIHLFIQNGAGSIAVWISSIITIALVVTANIAASVLPLNTDSDGGTRAGRGGQVR